MLIIRLVYSFGLVGSFFALPWWWTLIWMLAGLIIFAWYAEAVLVGVAFDAVFSPIFPQLTVLVVVFAIGAEAGKRLWYQYVSP